MGDLNMPHIDWEAATVNEGGTSTEILFLEQHILGRSHQHVKEPTRSIPNQKRSCLDVLITDSECRLSFVTISDPIGTSDHCSITARLNQRLQQRSNQPLIPNVWKADIGSLVAEASKLEWLDDTLTGSEEIWSSVHNKLKILEERHVPLKKAANTLRSPPWIDRDMRRMLNSRHRAWLRFRESCLDTDYDTYREIRNVCKSQLRGKRKHHEKLLIAAIPTAPKKIFTYINRRLRKTDDIPALKTSDSIFIEGNTERANLLAQQFCSVFNQPSLEVRPDLQSFSTPVLPLIQCNEKDVLKLLLQMDTGKAPGPDGHHPYIIKSLAPVIVKALTTVFNRSLVTEVLPTDWKVASIKPMFKGGDKHLAQNYRPISLTSVIVKILEKVVKRAITWHMTSNNLLTTVQHGFTERRSCITNLILAREDWVQIRNNRGKADAVFIDFSKAFDKVDHGILRNKLFLLGIGESNINWISNFLHNRRNSVRVNGEYSDDFTATSGVPQGSVLGPVLFNIYVNDLPSRLNSECLFFADDLKIWCELSSVGDSTKLQNDLDTIAAWADEMKLPINTTKSQLISIGKTETINQYTLNDISIPREKSVRDLGVMVRGDLKTHDHTLKARKSGLRMLWALKRTFKEWSATSVPRLFSTFVRPIMEYGAPAYFPSTKKECFALERVQRLATRMIPGWQVTSYEDRCTQLNLFLL
jgi:hypothetical protein